MACDFLQVLVIIIVFTKPFSTSAVLSGLHSNLAHYVKHVFFYFMRKLRSGVCPWSRNC